MTAKVVTLRCDNHCASCREYEEPGTAMTEVDGRLLCASCLEWVEQR